MEIKAGGLFVLGSCLQADGGMMDAPPELVATIPTTEGKRFPILFLRMPISDSNTDELAETIELRFMFVSSEAMETFMHAVDQMLQSMQPGTELKQVTAFEHDPVTNH